METKKFIETLGNISKFEFGGLSSAVEFDVAIKQNKCTYFLGEVEKPKVGTNRNTGDDDIVAKKYFAIDLDIRKDLAKRGQEITDSDILDLAYQIRNDIDDIDYFNERSYIIYTGNGLHIFYAGDYIKDIDKVLYTLGVQKIYNQFTKIFEDKYGKENIIETDPSTTNIGRILRLPGTKNCKNLKDIKQTSILFEQKKKSRLVGLINKFGLEYKKELDKNTKIEMELQKRERKTKSTLAKISTEEIKDLIDGKDIYEIIDACGLSHTSNRIYEGDRLTNGWRIHKKENYVNNLNKGQDRADGGPYSFVMKHHKYDTKRTIERFCEKYSDVNDLVAKEKIQYQEQKENISNEIVEIASPDEHIIEYGELLNRAKESRQNLSDENLCKYGIGELDKYLYGILPDELVVVGAQPGVGKSEIAYNIAITNAMEGKKVLLFSLEGNIEEIALRHMQREIYKKKKITTGQYRFNKEFVNDVEDKVVEDMSNSVKNNLLIFNKTAIPSLSFIKQMIKQKRNEVDMIIIDHLHYIDFKTENENRETGEIMRELKTLTDIIKKPVILVSHMRKPQGKLEEPTMFDLHGSSNISKEATTIVMICKGDIDVSSSYGHTEEETRRYSATKFISPKSRIGLGELKLMGIYDRYAKEYKDDGRELLDDSSVGEQDIKMSF